MEFLVELQTVLIGLIGWAATVLIVDGSSRLNLNDKRAMIVCSWMIWMIPGFGGLVMRGVLMTDTAALYVGVTTVALGMIMALGAFLGTRRRS
ncbi:MAG: hypothetical protein AB4911_13250 [Oscillochloridaceae bacterium umkhey_bin13]